MSKILVTGGAGYVGSVIVKRLSEDGHRVTVVDNLITGNKEALPDSVRLEKISFVRPPINIFIILQVYRPDIVIHLAARMSPTESVSKPSEYFRDNVAGTIELLDVMLKSGIKKMIFASTAAIYNNGTNLLETDAVDPLTPYGESKLMIERILDWYRRAYGMKYIAFRFFPVSGGYDGLGPAKSYNKGLIPYVLEVPLGQSKVVPIYGNNYPTPDGTGIRDYVHVKDIAAAHLIAVKAIDDVSGVYNLGSGRGYSVSEVIKKASKVVGRNIPWEYQERRPGDPHVLISSIDKAREELGWAPVNSDIENIIKDTWEWMQEHPNGYKGASQ